MVALAAAAMAAPGETRQASAAPTALDFSPAAIALENAGDTATIDVVVTGLVADEADTAQINIQHGSDFTISNVDCGPLYSPGGFASGATAVTGGTAFICSLQNGPTADVSGVVASFDITKVGDTTGLVTLDFKSTGSLSTSFYEAGSPVSPGTLGSLAVWDLLENVGNQTVNEGQTLNFSVTTTTEPPAPTLSHSVVSGPTAGTFIGFTPATGSFSINPGFDDAGVYVVEVTANNGTVSGTESFQLTVEDVNRAPVLAVIGAQSVAENSPLNVPLSATDADDPTGTGLTLTATIQQGAGPIVPIPDGFSTITDNGDGTGSLDFNPGFADEGTYTVVVTVTDSTTASNGALTDSETFTLTVTNTNQNPVVTAIPDQNVDEGKSLDVAVVSSDPDGQIPTLSATINSLTVPDLFAIITPTGDGSTATLSFTPDFGDVGVYTVVVTADDGTSGTGSDTFTLTVNDVASITAPAGTVKLQGLPDRGTEQVQHDLQFNAIAPLVELVRVTGGVVEASMTVNADGSFAFHDVPTTTTYRLRVSAAGYFTHELGTAAIDEIDVSLSDFDLTALSVEMLGGLVIPGSTVVDVTGLSVMLSSLFDTTSTGLTGRLDAGGNIVDINADEIVDGGDISTLVSNIGKSGDQPWS